MIRRYRPDRRVDSFQDVDPGFLSSLGKRFLLIDIDGTLVPHGSREAPLQVADWLERLRSNGIGCFVVSNAGKHRTAEFCRPLGIPFLARSHKPSALPVRKALSILGASPEEAVFLGDQLFTDISSAKKAGVGTVLVRSASPMEPWNVGFKRIFERLLYRVILTDEERRHGWEA